MTQQSMRQTGLNGLKPIMGVSKTKRAERSKKRFAGAPKAAASNVILRRNLSVYVNAVDFFMGSAQDCRNLTTSIDKTILK